MRLMLVQTVLLAALLVMTAPAGAITFADGMSHEVDAVNTYPFESVVVLDAPGGSPTTVHVLPGGQIGTLNPGGTLHAFGNSLISVSGGLISVLELRDNASAIWTGGQIAVAIATENSILEMTGGRGAIDSQGDATVIISGGNITRYTHQSSGGYTEINGGIFETEAAFNGNAVAVINGGTFFNIEANGNSVLRIFGGMIGGSLATSVGVDPMVSIYGSGFSFPYGELPPGDYVLTGVLTLFHGRFD